MFFRHFEPNEVSTNPLRHPFVRLGPPGGRNGTAARQGIEFDYVHATLQINDWTF
jgi:hypothetical protein